MKAIIIARVSTEEQKEAGNSLPAQIVRLEKYCQNKGFNIVKKFSFDESAYKEKRDEFDRLLEVVQEISKKEKIASLSSLSQDHDDSFKSWLELSEDFFNTVFQARETIENGTIEAKQIMLKRIGENFLVKDKRLDISFKKPYDILLKPEYRTNMLRTVNDVRTIIQQQNEYIYIPDLRAYVNA